MNSFSIYRVHNTYRHKHSYTNYVITAIYGLRNLVKRNPIHHLAAGGGVNGLYVFAAAAAEAPSSSSGGGE